jgi:hypothetical protein
MELSQKNVKNDTFKLCCNVCNKEYTRKSSLDKHKILCDFKMKTKREHQIEIEELADIPNHYQLVKIVQELTLKMIKMEEQMEEMKFWVDKKKRKVNVVVWLNTNVVPTIGFLEWINISVVKPEHFESLMENSLFHTIQQVFEHNLCEKTDFIYPIKCFTQKQGNFYICENKHDGSPEWRQLVLTDMVSILKTIQRGFIKQLTNWKKDNKQLFDDNDRVSISFNKAVIKVMDISFTQDATLSRIKNNLYNYLKTELNIIDQQLEF